MNERLQKLLRTLRRALHFHLALGGLARVGAVATVAAFGTWLLDWWLRLEFAQRGMIGTLAFLLIAAAAWRYLLRPLSRRLGTVDLALALERAFPQFGDRLVTAAEAARGKGQGVSEVSAALLERVTAEAAEVAATVRPRRALDGRRLLQQLSLGAVALAAVALALAVYPQEVRIWWQRSVLLRDVDWLRATQLALVGFPNGTTRIVRGAPLDITVAASGRRIPDTVRLELDYEHAGRFREVLTASAPGRFAKHFDAVVESFSFRARGGDGETPVLRVEVVDPPMLRDVKIRLTYPAYTRQPPREIGPGDGAVEAVVGAEIELRAVSTKPLRAAKLQAPSTKLQRNTKPQTPNSELKDTGAIVAVENATNIVGRLTVAESGPVQLAIEDVEGLRNNRALAFALYAQPDRPPTGRLTLSGIGDKITPQATLPVGVEARDDFGVAALGLAWSTNNNQWTSQPLAGATLGGAEARAESRWPVEPLRLREGALLNLRVEATDGATPPGCGQSQPLALRVVSAQELLQDLVRRQKEYRVEFERLSRKHREVLDSLRAIVDNPKSKIPNAKFLAAWLADEREVGNGCQTIAELFRRIVEEMQNNRVGTPAELERLQTRIAGPLTEVGQQLLGTVVAQLGAITPSQSAPLNAAFDSAQTAYERMRAILAEMMRNETLADAIATLRDILKDQNQLNEATKKALEEEIQRLLNRP